MTQGQYKTILHHQWMPMTYNFVGEWGEMMVINDVRIAVNDIEESLEMARTSLPPFLRIPMGQ